MNETGHLTSEARAAYWERTLAPQALLEVSDHLQECTSCRQELLRDKPPFGLTGSGAESISYEELVAWMEGDLEPAARRELAERISNSSRTSIELVNLLRFRDEMNELPAGAYSPAAPPRSIWGPTWVLPLAAGLALGLAFLWLTTIGRERSGRVAFVDQGKQLVVRQNGAIPVLGELPDDLQQAVRDAVSLGRITLPATLTDLGGSSEELAGAPASSGSLRAIAPIGMVTETEKPLLRWSAEPGATGYRVNLSKSGGELTSSPLLPPGQTTWTPAKNLLPNEVYEWEVEALRDGELLAKAPAPPEPEARFRVLDSATRARLEEQRRKFGGSHLVMGLLYAKAGLLAEARTEFEKLARENPQSELPGKLLTGLTTR
jgi:hypothetical protein